MPNQEITSGKPDSASDANATNVTAHVASTPSPVMEGEPEIVFSRKKWMKLLLKGENDQLAGELARSLNHFTSHMYLSLSNDKRAAVDDYIENFLYFFCHPDFKLPVRFVQTFIAFNAIISNIVAMSDFETTTPWVVKLAGKIENYFKVLVLHNVRTNIPINHKLMFDISPLVASEWWVFYWLSAPAFCSQQIYERIRHHLKCLDDRFMIFGALSRGSYFPVTYVAPELEQLTKERLNTLAAAAFANVKIQNKPSRKKIAIVTDRWSRSAVYTSLSPLINSLKGHYDLTLIHNGINEAHILDRDMFERTVCIKMINETMDLEPLQNNEFCAVIFPDVGMNAESIFLSNIRIAPVQVCMYGHPSSTWSTQMDYFIGGQEVEVLEKADKNYSERLVVIPGLGVYPVFPNDYTPTEVPPLADGDPFVINCGWTGQKVTYPLLAALQDILRLANKQIVFQMFVGAGASQSNGFLPFMKDLYSMLGTESVRVFGTLGHVQYLAQLNSGVFSMDSYPFGGFNTIIDALYCKKPVVAWQGDRAFNRFTSATLELIGMPELIAHSHEEYVDIVTRMINNDDFRNQMIAKVAALDLRGAFAKEEKPENFLKAINYLVENNDKLKAEGSKKPIVIG
jgi:hypothetical protein